MKKIFTTLFISISLFSFIKANAQCSSCTTTITGTDVANHIIGAGQVFCIAPTGTCTGLITVGGGTLCNQGVINSSNLWVTNAGAVFNNYGTITTTNVLVSNGAVFNNYGNASIDSLEIINTNSVFTNTASGTLNFNMRFMISSHAVATNNGIISSDYMLDSASATFTNNGNLDVNFDFGNSYSSNFINNSYFNIHRDFYNSTLATVTTHCMAIVGRDWYNSSSVMGNAIGTITCGGFNIAGNSLNSGTIGTNNVRVDMCDAGHPLSGIDANSGTIASTTTFCTCTNSCTMLPVGVGSIINDALVSTIYPNPANTSISLEYTYMKQEIINIIITDMLGKTQLKMPVKTNVGDNKTTLDVSALAPGLYVASIIAGEQSVSRKVFNVVR